MIGKLIVFEGPDGSGKTSLSSSLNAKLQEKCFISQLYAFPGNEPNTLGNLVYKLHHDAHSIGLKKTTTASIQALHIAAHLDAIESVIIPTLMRGEIVVLDRFWWSTKIYGQTAGVKSAILTPLIEAEKAAWGDWSPAKIINIRRRSPLRDEPMDAWQALSIAYEQIANSEASKGEPVYNLMNDKSFECALDEIILECSDIFNDVKKYQKTN